MLRCALEDAQADITRSGEGDVARLRIIDQWVPNHRDRSREKIDNAGRESDLLQNVDELRGDGRSGTGRLEDDRVARDKRCAGHTDHDRAWEVPGRDDRTHAERNVDELVVLASELRNGLLTRQAHHLVRVKFHEVD